MSEKKPLDKRLLGKVTVNPALDKDNGKVLCPEKYELVKKKFEDPTYLKTFMEAVEKYR